MTATLWGGAVALALLLVSARMQARRGINRWSQIPWDYLMLLFAIALIAALGHAAMLWRDSRIF